MSGCVGDFVSISRTHHVSIIVADRKLPEPGRRAIWRDNTAGLKAGIYHPSFHRRLISVSVLDEAGGGFFAVKGSRGLVPPGKAPLPVDLRANGLYIHMLHFQDSVDPVREGGIGRVNEEGHVASVNTNQDEPMGNGFTEVDSDADSEGWNERLDVSESCWEDAELSDEGFKRMLEILCDDSDEREALCNEFSEDEIHAMVARVRRTDGKARRTHDPERGVRKRAPTARERLEHQRNAHLWTPSTVSNVCWCPECLTFKGRRDGIPGSTSVPRSRIWLQRVQFDFKGQWRVQAMCGSLYLFNGVESSTGWVWPFGVETKDQSEKAVRYLRRFEGNPGTLKVDNEPALEAMGSKFQLACKEPVADPYVPGFYRGCPVHFGSPYDPWGQTLVERWHGTCEGIA